MLARVLSFSARPSETGLALSDFDAAGAAYLPLTWFPRLQLKGVGSTEVVRASAEPRRPPSVG